MRGPSWLLVLLFVLPGCIDLGNAPEALPPTGTFAADVLVLAAPPIVEEPRSLAEAPSWRSGEWWRIRLTDFTGDTFEVTRVVAGVEGDDYLVGMPATEWINDFMVLHIPGFGEVAREDLSYETHDVRYEPLRFPLTQGAKWATAFEGQPMSAEVKTVVAHLAPCVRSNS